VKHIRDYARRVIGWLRAGYPQGVPDQDYQPLLAVLSRRLTEEELTEVCDALLTEGIFPADRADIGVELTKVLGELPGERDMERVAAHLEASGWPVDRELGGDGPDDGDAPGGAAQG